MLSTLSKRKQLFLLITLFLTGTITMSEFIITPTINLLFTYYPNKVGCINFAVTGCYAVSIVMTFLMDKLSRKYSIRALMIVGAIIGTIAGLFTFLVVDALALAIARGIMMISYGITKTVAIVLINSMYEDPGKRGQMMGIYQAVVTGLGAVFSLISGFLAETSLRLAYGLHLLIPVYLIMVLFFVPKDISVSSEQDHAAASGPKDRMGTIYWVLAVIFGLFIAAASTLSYYGSVYLAENNLGSSGTAGVFSTLCTGAGFCTGFLFGPLYKRAGKHILPLSILLAIIAYGMMWQIPNLILAAIGFIIFGIVNTCFVTFFYSYVPEIVPAERRTGAVAYLEMFSLITVCLITYFVTWVMDIAHMTMFTQFLIVPIVIMILCLIAILLVFRTKTIKNANF